MSEGGLVSAVEQGAASSRRTFLLGTLSTAGAVTALGASEIASAPYADAKSSISATEHLVRRATYGATPALLDKVDKMGRGDWLAQQMRPAKVTDKYATHLLTRWPRLHWPAWKVRRELGGGNWDVMYDLLESHIARAAWSNRQLLEVMVDFWSNHLNVTCPSSDVWAARHLYDRDVIRHHAFGKFSDMLVASAKSPAMLAYLDNANSDRTAPNENYARELMELHTVGLVYGEADVKAAARLLTGMSIDWDPFEYQYKPWMHSVGSVKILGWHNKNSTSNGEAAALAYVKYLARHPRTSHTIARKLAIRFVSDDPPAKLVNHLAAVYRKHDTDIKPVLSALFSSDAFAHSKGGKVRRPFEDLIATVRALGLRPNTKTDGLRQLYWVSGSLGQSPLGWHPPNGYPDVAGAWTSAGSTLARWNSHLGLAAGWWPNALVHPKLETLLHPRHPKTYGALVDAAAAGMGLPRPTNEVRYAVARFLGKQPGSALGADDEALNWRLPYVFALILDSPEYALR